VAGRPRSLKLSESRTAAWPEPKRKGKQGSDSSVDLAVGSQVTQTIAKDNGGGGGNKHAPSVLVVIRAQKTPTSNQGGETCVLAPTYLN